MMEPSIWRFLLFIGSEILFIAASVAMLAIIGILIIKKNAIKESYMQLASIGSSMISMLFMFLFTWILSGTNFFRIFAILFLVSVALQIIVEFTSLIVGVRKASWSSQLVWASHEYQKLAPRTNKAIQTSFLVALFAYAAYMGYGYFGKGVRAADWPQHVVQVTLIALIGFSWVVVLPGQIYTITSRGIAEDTRSRIFISQAAASVVVLLLVALFIWTIHGSGATVSTLGPYFVFAPTVTYAVVGYLIVFLICPYLIGHYGSKAWEDEANGQYQHFVDELAKDLLHPNTTKACDALDKSEQELQAVIVEANDDRAIKLGHHVSAAPASDYSLLGPRLALAASREQDPRFIRAARLQKLAELLADCKSQLIGKTDEKEKRDLLAAYSKVLEKENEAGRDESSAARPLVLSGLTILVGGIASPLITALVKFAGTQMGLGAFTH